jgi:hypothetical protein
MYSIITGTILLGITHALIPNHWQPLIVEMNFREYGLSLACTLKT